MHTDQSDDTLKAVAAILATAILRMRQTQTQLVPSLTSPTCLADSSALRLTVVPGG